MKERGKKVKAYGKDILLILVIFGIGVSLLAYTYLGKQNHPVVAVRVDGKVVQEFLLDDSIQYKIEGIGGTNTLCIDEGSAWLKEADCPDHYCMHRGMCNSGAQIVCLPNRLVIKFVENDLVDGVVG